MEKDPSQFPQSQQFNTRVVGTWKKMYRDTSACECDLEIVARVCVCVCVCGARPKPSGSWWADTRCRVSSTHPESVRDTRAPPPPRSPDNSRRWSLAQNTMRVLRECVGEFGWPLCSVEAPRQRYHIQPSAISHYSTMLVVYPLAALRNYRPRVLMSLWSSKAARKRGIG